MTETDSGQRGCLSKVLRLKRDGGLILCASTNLVSVPYTEEPSLKLPDRGIIRQWTRKFMKVR